MGCLNDIYCGKRVIIGIQDYYECANPESHLFINRLPGMELKMASAIASEQYHTGANLMKEKIKDAIKLVNHEFSELIAVHFDFNAILMARELRNFSDNTLSQVGKERGLVLKRWRSEMAHIYIDNLFIKVKVGGAATIKIIDGDTVKTINADLVSDKISKIRVDYKCESEQVRIVMDNTNFEVYSGSINNVSGCTGCGSRSSDLYITGWDGNSENAKYYGIGVDATIRCYEENAICKLLPRLYFLYWYRSGIEILKEGIAGNRLNYIASMGKDKMKELKKEYEHEYAKSMKMAETNIRTYLRTLRADCVICNSDRNVQSHP